MKDLFELAAVAHWQAEQRPNTPEAPELRRLVDRAREVLLSGGAAAVDEVYDALTAELTFLAALDAIDALDAALPDEA